MSAATAGGADSASPPNHDPVTWENIPAVVRDAIEQLRDGQQAAAGRAEAQQQELAAVRAELAATQTELAAHKQQAATLDEMQALRMELDDVARLVGALQQTTATVDHYFREEGQTQMRRAKERLDGALAQFRGLAAKVEEEQATVREAAERARTAAEDAAAAKAEAARTAKSHRHHVVETEDRTASLAGAANSMSERLRSFETTLAAMQENTERRCAWRANKLGEELRPAVLKLDAAGQDREQALRGLQQRLDALQHQADRLKHTVDDLDSSSSSSSDDDETGVFRLALSPPPPTVAAAPVAAPVAAPAPAPAPADAPTGAPAPAAAPAPAPVPVATGKRRASRHHHNHHHNYNELRAMIEALAAEFEVEHERRALLDAEVRTMHDELRAGVARVNEDVAAHRQCFETELGAAASELDGRLREVEKLRGALRHEFAHEVRQLEAKFDWFDLPRPELGDAGPVGGAELHKKSALDARLYAIETRLQLAEELTTARTAGVEHCWTITHPHRPPEPQDDDDDDEGFNFVKPQPPPASKPKPRPKPKPSTKGAPLRPSDRQPWHPGRLHWATAAPGNDGVVVARAAAATAAAARPQSAREARPSDGAPIGRRAFGRRPVSARDPPRRPLIDATRADAVVAKAAAEAAAAAVARERRPLSARNASEVERPWQDDATSMARAAGRARRPQSAAARSPGGPAVARGVAAGRARGQRPQSAAARSPVRSGAPRPQGQGGAAAAAEQRRRRPQSARPR